MNTYTTLYFDIDHTLLDFKKTEQKALRQTFKAFHIPCTPALFQNYLEINQKLWSAYEDGVITRDEILYSRFQILFDRLNIHANANEVQDAYQKALAHGYDLIDHALDVIKQLSCNYDLYITSNGVVQTQYPRLHHSGLYPYFTNIFISEELGHQKPTKQYFEACFKRTKEQDHSKILLIGDSLASDIQGGINANIDTCWFNPEYTSNTKHIQPTYEIHSLLDLFILLEGGKQNESKNG